jgi:hypothetical protein
MPTGGCRASCEHAMRQVNTGPSAFDSSGESKDIPASLSSESGIVPGTQASLKSPARCSFLGCAQCAPRYAQTLIESLAMRFLPRIADIVFQDSLIRHCPYSEFPSKSSPWATMLVPKWAIGRVFSLSSPSLRFEMALTYEVMDL